MATETVLDRHIEVTPGVAGGKPRVAGHRITVQNIVIWHEWIGLGADEIATELTAGPAAVAKVERRQRRRRPQPPFITSTLQQEAARKLRFAAKRTMRLAQRLYEGVEVGDEGPVGLITYMRTDSTNVSKESLKAVRG